MKRVWVTDTVKKNIWNQVILYLQCSQPECEEGLSELATVSDVFPRHSLLKPGALWQMTMPQHAADACKALCAYEGRGSNDECRFMHQREHHGVPPPWQQPYWSASHVITLSLLERPRKPLRQSTGTAATTLLGSGCL
jgi:hypothetical protein